MRIPALGMLVAATMVTPAPAFAEVFTARIYFDWDSAALTRDGESLAGIWAEQAMICEKQGIRIIGHADPSEPAERSDALSQQRAEAVKSALVRSGVSPSAIIIEACGRASPAAPTPDGERQPLNRRAELVITCP